MREPVENQTFDLAPIAMWIEDFSGVKTVFDQWRREGIDDVESFLREDKARIESCSRQIRVLRVNRKTLELFEADDLDHLIENIGRVFRDDMLDSHINELTQLWHGNATFSSNTVNYSLSGKRLDIQLKGSVLPGYEASLGRVLLTTEDVTAREDARRQELRSRLYAEGIFQHSPVSLWVEDFSRVRSLLEDIRQRGIVDFRVFTDVHPEFVRQCMSEIRVIDINQATLDLFCAPDKKTLLMRLSDIFRDGMETHFKEQLIELWNGNLFHHREVLNYALDGTERHLLLQFSVLPGYEQDWSLVQVALTDITARKKAEAYLEYLGKHDVLTKLCNRAFYMDELNRLQRSSLRPVSVIIIDLNGLKETNDCLGHDAGDKLLRRIGEVLEEATSAPDHAARIGGDEFAVLMPGSGEEATLAMVENIERLLHINNQYYSNLQLSMSLGFATSAPGETMESLVKRADAHLYTNKRAFYAQKDTDRRAG